MGVQHADIDHTGIPGVGGAPQPLDTTDSPQFAGVNIGNASDTTLTRISAGVVAIEGTNIVKAGAATGSGLTMATARLLGRTTGSTGAIEEITVGAGLSLSAGALTASGGSGIPAGTSFPGSPSSGDQFFRTDLGLPAYYDGTRWLSMHIETVSFPPTNTLTSVSATTNQGRLPIPHRGVYSLYVVGFDWLVVLSGVAHSGTNYYTFKLNYADASDSDTQVGSTLDSQSATTINNNYSFHQTVAAALSTNARELKMRLDKVNSGADMTYSTGTVSFRLILT